MFVATRYLFLLLVVSLAWETMVGCAHAQLFAARKAITPASYKEVTDEALRLIEKQGPLQLEFVYNPQAPPLVQIRQTFRVGVFKGTLVTLAKNDDLGCDQAAFFAADAVSCFDAANESYTTVPSKQWGRVPPSMIGIFVFRELEVAAWISRALLLLDGRPEIELTAADADRLAACRGEAQKSLGIGTRLVNKSTVADGAKRPVISWIGRSGEMFRVSASPIDSASFARDVARFEWRNQLPKAVKRPTLDALLALLKANGVKVDAQVGRYETESPGFPHQNIQMASIASGDRRFAVAVGEGGPNVDPVTVRPPDLTRGALVNTLRFSQVDGTPTVLLFYPRHQSWVVSLTFPGGTTNDDFIKNLTAILTRCLEQHLEKSSAVPRTANKSKLPLQPPGRPSAEVDAGMLRDELERRQLLREALPERAR